MVRNVVAVDIWDELLDALLPDGEGSVVVLRAYIDASAREHVVKGEKGDLITVAGYMFESLRVRRFRQQWKDTFGPDSFSWADLIARAKPFRHLRDNQPEHDRLVAAGIGIIRDFVIAGTVVSCWKQDVEQHGPTWIKGFGHAYSVAGHMAMAGLGLWAERHNIRGGISYVIEAGDEGYDQLAHLLSYAPKSPDAARLYQWGGHGVTPKTACSPFHAPDMLAWEWGKFISETAVERKRPIRMSLAGLLVDRLDRYTFQHLHGENLLRFFKQLHALGVEQMQEDRAAASSVASVDLSEAVQSYEPTALGGDPE